MHPTPSNSPALLAVTPGRVMLFCSEALRPAVCCVVDALEVRGYVVSLRTGRNAGAVLQRSRRRCDADLRVVFAPEALDHDVHRKLLHRLDPDKRGDVLLMPFDRPLDAIESIVRAFQRLDPLRPRRRPTRTVLAHPTMVERQLEVGRWWRPVMAGAATMAAMVAMTAVVEHEAIFGIDGLPGIELVASESEAVEPIEVIEPEAIAVGYDRSAVRSDPMALAASRPGAWSRTHDQDDLDELDDLDQDLDAAFDRTFDADPEVGDDEIVIFDEPAPTTTETIAIGPADDGDAIEQSDAEPDVSPDDAATEALLLEASDPLEIEPAPVAATTTIDAPKSRRADKKITLADPFAM